MIAPNVPHDLRNYFDRIYWPRQLGKCNRTCAMYAMTLDRFDEHLGASATLDNLNDDDLCGFLRWRLDNGRASCTVAKERTKLLALWRFAARKHHVPNFPDVPAVPIAEKQPRALARSEVDNLLLTCRNAKGMVGRAPASAWWRALYLVALVTGERTGAMLSLRWNWLRDDGHLCVPAEARKGHKPAIYFLPETVLAAVDRLRGLTDELIFARPFTLGAFYARNKTILKHAGLPQTREFQPHICRRTFASWLEASGGNATEALQHSTRTTTKRSYLDPLIVKQAPASVPVARALGFAI